MPQKYEMKFYSNQSPKKGYSWENPPEAIPESDIAETVTTDVLVIGGGISGLAASARCVDKGLRVITLDKNKHLVALAGQIAAINSRVMKEKGLYIDKKQFAADWLKICGSRVQEDLLWIFINRSAEGFHWLLELGGDDIEEVKVYVGYRGPMFNEYPGTHHVYKKKDCKKYHAPEGGILVCEIFQNEILNKGGQILRGTTALYLEKNNEGRVTGCIAKCSDGLYRRYSGEKAVVLATGDISDNDEMLEAFCPIGLKPGKKFPRKGNTGDGQKMAYWAGASLDNPQWAAVLHSMAYSAFEGFFLHVNVRGERFMNEDTWLQAKSVRCLMQPGGDHAFTIMDSKFLDEMEERWDEIGGQGNAILSFYGEKMDREALTKQLEKDFRLGNAYKADTIEELATLIDVPADKLKQTVARYNEIVEAGDDVDFGKRSRMLTSIVKPPFYATKWGPALLDVMGGVLINSNLNVIGSDSNPIPGLYAVGNTAGGMYSIDYPLLLNGNSYGRALAYAMQLGDVLSSS